AREACTTPRRETALRATCVERLVLGERVARVVPGRVPRDVRRPGSYGIQRKLGAARTVVGEGRVDGGVEDAGRHLDLPEPRLVAAHLVATREVLRNVVDDEPQPGLRTAVPRSHLRQMRDGVGRTLRGRDDAGIRDDEAFARK